MTLLSEIIYNFTCLCWNQEATVFKSKLTYKISHVTYFISQPKSDLKLTSSR
jgi:hypothetical protein